MKGEGYFAVLDLGSSSFRCALLNSKDNIIKLVQKPVRPDLPKTGYVQYDGEKLLKLQIFLLDKILNFAPNGAKILAIGIASQRSTIVLWDKNTGKTLCPVLSWQDGRAGSELKNIKLSQEEVFKITGLYKTPYYSAAKISWCIKNFSKVKSAQKKGTLLCGALPTYLIWHLTRGRTFAIDPTMAQRTLLFDINKLKWSNKLLASFGVKQNILPKITPSNANFGAYKNIPIITMLGDQQSALAGVKAFKKGDAMLNYGTGAFLLANTGNKIMKVPGLLTSVNWQDEGKKASYILEGTIHSAGSIFDWLKKLGFDFDIKKLDYYCTHSATNPLVLPALGGLGAPYWDFTTEVVMAGLSPQSKKEDIIKGALQGIAFLASVIAGEIRKSGIKINEIKVSGGLSASDYLLGFQSDLMQIPTIREQERETTLKGVYYLMLKHKNIFPFYKGRREGILPQPKKFTPKLTSYQSQGLFNCWHRFLELSRQICRI